MTKVEALKALLEENGGVASWRYIYDNIERYYPPAKSPAEWEAALRGVLYREIRNNRNFKRIGFGVYALAEYEREDPAKVLKDRRRMHPYMEGVMVEIGNREGYRTYCADPSAAFQPNVFLSQLTTLHDFPPFTYPEIVERARRIDVVWFTAKGDLFPKRAVEIVDSLGTLGDSLFRMYQLKEFQTEFYVLADRAKVGRIKETLDREPYSIERRRFTVKSYDKALEYYKALLKRENVSF
ncbi:MAG TPA: hypothetical protein ENN88_03355 [Candidatus Coatesbacteria bacterium]|nr:hypothetical protein [Candidatus Coatesbacteria bacterium]